MDMFRRLQVQNVTDILHEHTSSNLNALDSTSSKRLRVVLQSQVTGALHRNIARKNIDDTLYFSYGLVPANTGGRGKPFVH